MNSHSEQTNEPTTVAQPTQVPEGVGTPTAEQQHGGAERRQRDDEHQRQRQ